MLKIDHGEDGVINDDDDDNDDEKSIAFLIYTYNDHR